MTESGGSGVGAAPEDTTLPDGRPVHDLFRPVRGYTLTAGVGAVQVVFAVTLAEPGAYSWTDTTLSYRIGDRQASRSWAVGGRVCADDPRPTDCGTTAPTP